MERCSFDRARFGARVIFEGNYKSKAVPGSVILNGAMFDSPQRVLFKDVFLPQMAFSGCDIATVTILNLRSSPVSNTDCHILGDEVQLERELRTVEDKTLRREKYKDVIECYQRIQRNMLSAKNNSSAGKFHVRELELERTMRSGFGRLPFSLYKWLAYYGERIGQPLMILFSVLLLIPVLTMLVMGDHNYDWSGQLSDIPAAIGGWFRDFVSNLRCIFYLDNDVFGYKIDSDVELSPGWHFLFIFEKLFSIVMLSFVVVAFRRRFRRY